MTWIKVVSPQESEAVRDALMAQAEKYPSEYAPSRDEEGRLPKLVMNDSIVLSHSLIPEALRHAFGTFAALMNPDLPLSRRQHEMIAATVSSLNRCFY